MKNETVAKKKVDVSSFALYIGAVLILICFTIVCKIAGKDFLTLRNIQNIISQSSCVAVVAIGASLVILTGGIDLSAGSVIGFVGIFAALFIKNGVPIAVAFLIGLAAGALIGLVNGVIISCGKVPAFIATLGTMNICLLYTSTGSGSSVPTRDQVPELTKRKSSSAAGTAKTAAAVSWDGTQTTGSS